MKILFENSALSKPVGLGTAVESIAKPVASLIDSITSRLPPDWQTQLEKCPTCAAKAAQWNEWIKNINPLA